jgi:hypothetical protein
MWLDVILKFADDHTAMTFGFSEMAPSHGNSDTI